VDADVYAPIAEIYDVWCAEVVEDVRFYWEACAGADGPVVELGAGTGRIAVPLAREGHEVVAVDRSAPMLDVLRRRAVAAGVDGHVTTVVGDLRALPELPRTDRVLAPFRVLLHLADDDERVAFFRAVHDLLVPGGLLVFDVFEPTAADIRETHGRVLERGSGVRERATWNRSSAVLDLEVAFRGRRTRMRLHWVPGRRWPELLAAAGLSVVDAYAGFDGEPFTGRAGDSAWIAGRSADAD
jgi:SAM-dependent methyltransferase